MSGDPPLPQPFDDLISAYGDGEISEADLRRLEACLIESEEARKAFVEDFQFRTELHFAVRARHAAIGHGREHAVWLSEIRPAGLERTDHRKAVGARGEHVAREI